MKRIVGGIGALLAVVLVVGGGFIAYAWSNATSMATQAWEIPDHELSVPWPASESEEASARFEASFSEGSDPDTAVAERALKSAMLRGRHLVQTRLGCAECHGPDLGGKVVMDVPPVMGIIAPNITSGAGSATADYTPSDWVRILRHGVGRDGQASQMSAIDTAWLSDQEISDIITFVQARPPVDRELPQSYLGPVMYVQLTLGKAYLSAFLIDHDTPRRALPPANAPSVELGEHLAFACSECHGVRYVGGPILGGDPDRPEAANLTFHASGLEGWTWEQFDAAVRKQVRPDGTALEMMPGAYANLSETETRALYAYFRSLDPAPKGR